MLFLKDDCLCKGPMIRKTAMIEFQSIPILVTTQKHDIQYHMKKHIDDSRPTPTLCYKCNQHKKVSILQYKYCRLPMFLVYKLTYDIGSPSFQYPRNVFITLDNNEVKYTLSGVLQECAKTGKAIEETTYEYVHCDCLTGCLIHVKGSKVGTTEIFMDLPKPVILLYQQDSACNDRINDLIGKLNKMEAEPKHIETYQQM